MLVGTIYGYLGATMESAGGVEQLVNAGAEIVPTIKKWLITLGTEGIEEVAQGITENAVQKGVYAKNKPWFSMTDPDAVFSGTRGGQELVGGAVVGGLYGLPTLT